VNELIEYGIMSIKGKVRQKDEDSAMCMINVHGINGCVENTVSVAAVADGMGGGEKGEIASKIAVNTLIKNLTSSILEKELSKSVIIDLLTTSVREANQAIMEYAKENNLSSIGTTLTAALMESDQVYVVNIGDSRTYLISKDGRIKKKTKDHSYVQQLVDNGLLKEIDVKKHPQRNIVTKILNGGGDAEPDIYQWQIFRNDYVLLCCDGLWEPLTDEIIGKTISSGGSPQETVKTMVEAADEIDGSDNITAIILRKSDGMDEGQFLNVQTMKRSS
jgi:protein phosphatase